MMGHLATSKQPCPRARRLQARVRPRPPTCRATLLPRPAGQSSARTNGLHQTRHNRASGGNRTFRPSRRRHNHLPSCTDDERSNLRFHLPASRLQFVGLTRIRRTNGNRQTETRGLGLLSGNRVMKASEVVGGYHCRSRCVHWTRPRNRGLIVPHKPSTGHLRMLRTRDTARTSSGCGFPPRIRLTSRPQGW